jgi:hypothetical protein
VQEQAIFAAMRDDVAAQLSAAQPRVVGWRKSGAARPARETHEPNSSASLRDASRYFAGTGGVAAG